MVNLPKFRFLKFRLFLLSLKGRVSPAMADLINEVRWSRGIGPSPGHLAATDEEELPEMPTVTHAFPLGAAGGRADHQPLRSRPNLLLQDLGRSA